MTAAIAAGDILIDGGTRLPDSLTQLGDSPMPGWLAVKTSRATFEKEVEAAGWTTFFMAGEMKATVWGFDRRESLRTALARLGAVVKSESCNCMEIARVTEETFLKVPYVSVWAHARHVQSGQGLAFSRRRPNPGIPEYDRIKFNWRQVS